MRLFKRIPKCRRRSNMILIAVALAFPTYFEQVAGVPVDTNQWPTFPRRNIAALARDGYLKHGGFDGFKRSISTLAKNGQLPTFKSPYDERDDTADDDSHEKRNLASIARLRSYSAMKRNVQALARDGYRGGRGNTQQNDKRNMASMAHNGYIHKRNDIGDEYYYPFYQNQLPPLSEIDGPLDFNELYDLQQSINPDMFPPLSQVYKRSLDEPISEYVDNHARDPYWYLKRGAAGLPAHGFIRPGYVETNSRTKRYILTLPDMIDSNDLDPEIEVDENGDKRSVDEDSDIRENFEKRHIGSLARLGLLPSFRFSGGRYSRSGRARLLWPSQEMYRKHSPDENFGIREYFTGPEADAAYSDDSNIQAAAVPPHSHPTGRIINGLNFNDVPVAPPIPLPPLPPPNYIEAMTKNRWQTSNEKLPKFYYFRSLKLPHPHTSKRYLLIPAVDNILLRKGYRNSSLPSRRKNQ